MRSHRVALGLLPLVLLACGKAPVAEESGNDLTVDAGERGVCDAGLAATVGLAMGEDPAIADRDLESIIPEIGRRLDTLRDGRIIDAVGGLARARTPETRLAGFASLVSACSRWEDSIATPDPGAAARRRDREEFCRLYLRAHPHAARPCLIR